jgi:hypothetical protein
MAPTLTLFAALTGGLIRQMSSLEAALQEA